jgi:TetR/AcrR family fatty acid metabolism transcriptional regulator
LTLSSSQTRERILEAAEAVFADNGYHDAIVDEIGRRTSLSKGGLYFHFPSKEGLFFAVLDRLADRLVKRAGEASAGDGPALERADRALRAVLLSLSRRRQLARLLMVQGYSMGNSFERKRAEIFDRFAEVIRARLAEATAAGETAPGIDPALAARIWLGAVNELVIHWLYTGGPGPAERVNEISGMLRRGVVARAGTGAHV